MGTGFRMFGFGGWGFDRVLELGPNRNDTVLPELTFIVSKTRQRGKEGATDELGSRMLEDQQG